ERRSDVLAQFNLASEDRDHSVFIDVNPGTDFVWYSLVTSASSGLALLLLWCLGQHARERDDEGNTTAERFDELPAIKSEVIPGFFEEFVAFDFEIIFKLEWVAHFWTSPGVSAAISMAFTIRW